MRSMISLIKCCRFLFLFVGFCHCCGWSGGTFWDGFARVSYSFLAGVFIYRSGWIVNNRLGFPVLAVLLTLAFLFPFSKWNLLSESVIVLLYFPFLIVIGAGE